MPEQHSTSHSQRLPSPAPDLEQPTHRAEPEEHVVTFPFRFSDLPLEIFQQILLCCAAPPEYQAFHPYHKVSPEWLPITQVCRSWRTIAHTYPLLWTMITPTLNLFWVDIMQELSRPLLLDVHLRVGRRDIGDRQVTMTAYNAELILRKVSHRMCSLCLDGPRDHVKSTLSSLRTASPILSLSLNLPPWDRGGAFVIPNNIFASNASLRSLSFVAERALQAPDWLLQGLTSFKTGGNVPLLGLLDALRQMPVLECFTLLGCTAVWDENSIFPCAQIPMKRLKEFAVRTESPRHFVLLATHLVIPYAVRKRLTVVRTLAAPICGLLTHWLQALPSLYASYTHGGLQNVRISGGPTRGRFLTWTNERHDDTARFCFELEWNMYPHTHDQVRGNEPTSPFYYLGALCDELNALGVRRVLVEGDPAHISVATGYWRQFFAQFPSVEELWLYPGTAEVLWSACTPPDAKHVLRSLKRVYVVEGRLSAEPPTLSRPNITPESDLRKALSGMDLNGSHTSPPSDGPLIERGENWREGLHSLDVRPGLMALLRNGTALSREVHLRNCEVEDGALVPLCALAKVRMNYN